MLRVDDTIAAVSTPQGRGAVSIVRVSGARARDVVGLLLDRPLPRVGRLERRLVCDPETKVPLDEALVVFFQAPDSYTGEDVVELHLHGNPVLVSEVLAGLNRGGSRLAGPGEFTLRAFLNGKKDLAQAEAVGDLAEASSPDAVRAAARQLLGGVSQEIDWGAAKLLDLLVRLEAELDFPEDVGETLDEDVKKVLEEVLFRLRRLAASHDTGRRLREGFKVVLAGLPNVGKSSLFNVLLGRDRAIVCEEPGTTRDYLEETLAGTTVPVVLVDTAGLRPGESRAESAGVSRSRELMENADLVLLLYEAGAALDDELSRMVSASSRFLVETKADRAADGPDPAFGIHRVSSVTGQGVSKLREAVCEKACREVDSTAFEVLLMSRRQFDAVSRAVGRVEESVQRVGTVPADVLASLVGQALSALREVTGEGPLSEAILEGIFSGFCIGK